MDINKKIDLFLNFWYKFNKVKKIVGAVYNFLIIATFLIFSQYGFAQIEIEELSPKESTTKPSPADIQKSYKTSFAYYLKRVAQGAPIQEKINILERIKEKYQDTEVDLTRVISESTKLKKQLPESKTNEKSSSQQVVLSAEQNLEMKRREQAIAEKTKEIADSTLKKYYNKDNFIVTVNVALEKIPLEKLSKEDPEIEGEIFEKGTVEMPGLPVTSSPVFKEEEKKEEQQVRTWEQVLRIKWMKITILLKEGEFKQNDKDFIASVVKMKSGFDETRGDILSIQELPFPPIQIAEAGIAVPSTSVKPETKFELRDYAGWILSAILIVIVFSLLSKLSKAKREMHPLVMPQAQAVPPVISAKEAPAPSAEKLKEDEKKKLLEEVKDLMVTTLIGNPEVSTRVIKNWVADEKEEGLSRAATLIKTTDPRMIDTLSEEFGSDLVAQLGYAVSQVGDVEKDTLENIYRKFKDDYAKELQNEIREHGLSKEKDIFIFLRKLEPHQVLNILQDEPPGVIAVGLAQLTSQVAGQIISELPEEKKYKVPLEMGKLKKIPAMAYYDIADRLSRKALGVANIRYVATDGTGSLVNILENLDFETEQEVLSKIKQQDLSLANEIRKIYISLPDIVNLSNRFLSEVLRTINQETITKMLVEINPELKDKIINNLPARVKIIVQDSINQYKDISPEEIAKAQREFLDEIRNLAKTGKVNLIRILEEGEAEKVSIQQQTQEQLASAIPSAKEEAKT